MKLITRDTDYAIRALCYIAKCNKKVVDCRDLAKKLKIPRPFLRKILQQLKRGGLLKSYKGMGGGFVLSRSPKKILLTDIMRIFQGPVRLNEHIFKKRLCPHIRTCVLKKRLDVIERHIKEELESISVGSLMRDI